MKSFCQIPLLVLSGLRRSGEALASLLYPPHCANCQVDTPAGSHLCAQCAADAPRVTEPFCRQCSQPFPGEIDGAFVCSNCAGRSFHFLCAVSRYRGRGVVKEFIHRFKYNRHFYLRHQLADWMAEALDDPRLQAPPIDFLVPVPLHRTRLRERMENLRGAFSVRHTPTVTDRHLLLIDDVLTTGSTVEECSRILLEAGAASVRVLTAARA
jgi:predicted amidophosphoribosyltransferase